MNHPPRARFLAIASCLALCLSGLAAQDFPCSGVILSDNVRIRKSPDLGSAILAKVNHGAWLLVSSKSDSSMAVEQGGENNWWFQVELPDESGQGWVFGGFLAIESRKASAEANQYPDSAANAFPNIDFALEGKDGTRAFRIVFFSACPDQGNDMPLYPSRDYIVFLDLADQSSLCLLRIPDTELQGAKASKSPDRFYFMDGDEGHSQRFVSAEAARDKVILHVEDQTNGGNVSSIRLVCSFDQAKREFRVDKADNVLTHNETGG
jgi:hypothetical protein